MGSDPSAPVLPGLTSHWGGILTLYVHPLIFNQGYNWTCHGLNSLIWTGDSSLGISQPLCSQFPLTLLLEQQLTHPPRLWAQQQTASKLHGCGSPHHFTGVPGILGGQCWAFRGTYTHLRFTPPGWITTFLSTVVRTKQGLSQAHR